MIATRPAIWPDDTATVQRLFADYQANVGVDLCFQGFAAELADLGKRYELVLLLERDGVAWGSVALGRKSADTAELKRLYVAPELRGLGLGRRLVRELLAAAQERGYERVVLDTVEAKMPVAVALYRELGFVETGRRRAGGEELVDMEWRSPEPNGKSGPGF
jgi:ribosomal protein S18 acetylase RimI-like enzyme